MPNSPLLVRSALLGVLASFVCGRTIPGASAGELVVPGPQATSEGNWENGFPFNIGYWQIPTMRYQQVFGASDWAAVDEPVLITEIRYRKDGNYGGGFDALLPDVQINLSTTVFAPQQLSRTFEDNVGDDDAVVFSGPLALSSAPTLREPGPAPFDIAIQLQKPFYYDPSKGNLLLDVRNFGSGRTTFFDSHVADDATSVSSTYAGGSVDSPTADFTYTGGLVTQFAFVPAKILVALDVAPGDDRNVIRLKSKGGSAKGKGKNASDAGSFAAAILSTDALDAGDIDASTLTLGDPDLPGAVSPASTTLQDVDADGDLDLVGEFDISSMVAANAIDLETGVLAISGYSVHGSLLEGADAVTVRR